MSYCNRFILVLLELRSSWYHQKLNIFEEEKISSGQSPQTRPRGRPKQQCLPVFDMNHGTLQSSDTVKSTSVNRPDSRHPSYRVIGTTRVKPDQLSSLNANKLGGLNKVSPVKSAELIVCKCGIRKLRSENVQSMFIFEVLESRPLRVFSSKYLWLQSEQLLFFRIPIKACCREGQRYTHYAMWYEQVLAVCSSFKCVLVWRSCFISKATTGPNKCSTWQW